MHDACMDDAMLILCNKRAAGVSKYFDRADACQMWRLRRRRGTPTGRGIVVLSAAA